MDSPQTLEQSIMWRHARQGIAFPMSPNYAIIELKTYDYRAQYLARGRWPCLVAISARHA